MTCTVISYFCVTVVCFECTLKLTVLNGGHVIAFQRLTFERLGWYLNFGAWFMKNVNIVWTERDKIMQ